MEGYIHELLVFYFKICYNENKFSNKKSFTVLCGGVFISKSVYVDFDVKFKILACEDPAETNIVGSTPL